MEAQKLLKDAIKAKTVLFNYCLNRWNEAEQALSAEVRRKKGRKGRVELVRVPNARASVAGTTLIPENVKILYIRERMRELVRKYAAGMQEYKAQVRQLRSLRDEELEAVGGLDEHGRRKYPLRPRQPYFAYDIKQKHYKEMIARAERERTDWEHLLAAEASKVSKSRRRPLNLL